MSAQIHKKSKLAVLQQCGTLNPRPQNVLDPLFQDRHFFDPNDLLQVKYEMLRRVQIEGKAVNESATAFGFSRPSFYHAQTAFEHGGLAGLLPQKPGPRRAHKLTDEIVAFVEHAWAAQPALRWEEMAKLVKQHFGLAVHPRSIERSLVQRKKKRR
jgi:transposase